MQLRQEELGPAFRFNTVHSKFSASERCLSQRTRRGASAKGFTLVEVMVATILLSMIILGILQVLIGSYRVAAKARYRDHARYIVKSFADQFLTSQSKFQNGTYLPIFGVTSATGVGLTWTTTDATTGVQIVTPGTSGGLVVPISDSTTGEAPVNATVMRQVWTLDPSSGSPGSSNDAAGSILRGDFTITFNYPPGATNAVPITQTISVIRAIP
jgi:prepilin-type N-terminal cleavage/methylation domain-containing protein